jgi:hypothetical protein
VQLGGWGALLSSRSSDQMSGKGRVRKLQIGSANVGNTEWTRTFGAFDAKAI